jgi:hypothetical protein
LGRAKGDMVKAKKFYCGTGPDADTYEVKRRSFRKEILEFLAKSNPETSQPGRQIVAQASRKD